MRKILFLVTEDWYFWSHRLPLARAAQAAGHEVLVATRVQDHGDRIRTQGFRLIPIGLRRSSRNPLCEIKAIYELYQIYSTEKPDLVHQVAIKPILYGSLAARFAGIKAIVNALTGLGYVFIAKGKKAFFLRSLITPFFWFAFSCRNCRGIFQNPEDRQTFIDRKIIIPEKAVLIRGSGVNTDLFSPVPEAEGEPKAILASRMLWDKGVGDLVEASKLLKNRGMPGRVILAGRPDPDNPASIPEEILTGWHEKGEIIWLGHRENIPRLLQQCHVAVLPSSYREGIPKCLLEAASAGLPLVATDVRGCREIVRNGVNGFIVPPKDPERLAQALATLLQNRELRQRMGKASREIAVNEFSEELVVRATLALYEELLGN